MRRSYRWEEKTPKLQLRAGCPSRGRFSPRSVIKCGTVTLPRGQPVSVWRGVTVRDVKVAFQKPTSVAAVPMSSGRDTLHFSGQEFWGSHAPSGCPQVWSQLSPLRVQELV